MSGINSKRSVYNAVTSLIGTIITIILGLIIPRLVLVNYGSETNGMINSINQFVMYLSLFEAGIGTTALQALYKPVAENDRNSINEVISALNKNYQRVGVAYFVVLILLAIVYPFLVLRDNSGLSFLTVFLCVLFSGLGNVVLFFAQGKYRILLSAEGKSYIMTTLQTFITVLISISKIVLINLGFTVTYVIAITFLCNLIQVAYICILIKKKYKWINLKTEPSKIALQKKGYVFIQQIAWMVFQNTDILILTFVCNLKVVSVYSMYKLVVSNVEKLLSIPIDSSSFALGQLFSQDKSKYTEMVDCLEVYYSSFCFAILASVYCLFTPFLKLYTKGVNDISYIDSILPLLFVLIELLFFMRKPMYNTITYAGHFKETTPQTLIEMGINLVVTLVLVYRIGIYGVLIGTIVALMYRFFDVVFYANKKLLFRKSSKTLIIYLVDFLLFGGVCVIYYAWNPAINSYAIFLLYGVIFSLISLLLYSSVFFLLFPNEREILFTFVWRKVRKKINS